MIPPKFLFFDLGKVIVDFSIERMCSQVGEVAGIEPARVREVVFDGDLQRGYECGRISSQQFYDDFCTRTGTRAEYTPLLRAASDIFQLNQSIVPVVAQLQAARYPMGILSNTCEGHWQHCLERFRLLQGFKVYILSYEVRAMKPGPEIFQAAARAAGAAPEEIFYTDDTAGHVAGARAVGIDAVQYTTTPELVHQLRIRGLRFNY